MEKELLEKISALLVKYGFEEEKANEFIKELTTPVEEEKATEEVEEKVEEIKEVLDEVKDEEDLFDAQKVVMNIIGKDFDLDKDEKLKEAILSKYAK